MVAVNLGLGFIGSPRSLMAATRLAAIKRAPSCFGSSGIPPIIGEQKANSQEEDQ